MDIALARRAKKAPDAPKRCHELYLRERCILRRVPVCVLLASNGGVCPRSVDPDA
jgi:hypothetical protein